MNYTLILLLYLFVAHFINELILLPFFIIIALTKQIKFRINEYYFAYICIIIVLFFIGLINFGLKLDLNQFIHFIIILVLIFLIKDVKFNLTKLSYIIKCFLIFNLLLFPLGIFLEQFEFAFYVHNGFYRYTGIFQEPSIAGLNFILLGLILLYNKDNIIWLIISLFFIGVTFSGSAFAILFILLMIEVKGYILKKKFLKYLSLFLLILIPVTIYLLSREDFQYLIIERFERVLEGSDTSSKLRFLAPLQVFEFTFLHSPIWGFGIGSIENVISQNRGFFDYFYFFSGEATSKINNGYAIIFCFGGISYFIVHIILLLSLYKKPITNKYYLLYFFLLIFPFFNGQFIHFFYWFNIYLLMHLKNEILLDE